MKLWVLPFFIGILAIFSGNLAYLVSLNEGFVDACLPYLEGCTSISKTGRYGLASILFKLTILPVMTLLSVYWLISYTSLKQNVLNKKLRSRIMVISGLIGSLFGILYAAFLGSEGDVYQLLRRLWSAFLTDYSVCIGPTWSNVPWTIDTDLDPEKGDAVLRESFIFIAPGNCLGLPSVALPMGVADGIPTGIQIYSELYREDLCLLAAEIIEKERDCPTPIDPVT